MAVENVEQQITPETAQLGAPEELHPVVAAFGGDIGAALEKSGEQISSRIQQLSQHMAMMNYWRGQQAKQDFLTQYKTATQDKLFNAQGTVTLPKNIAGEAINPGTATLSMGKDPSNTAPDNNEQSFETPAAIFNRKGNAAYGALAEYDQWHSQAKAQIVEQAKQAGLGIKNIHSLVIGMDNDYAANRNLISKHEAEQLDQSQQKSFLAGMQLDADNAITKQDPVSLGKTIDSINDSNNNLNNSQGKSSDDPVREVTANKFITQALNNSMVANLKTTGGDPTQFQGTLEKLKDSGKISDEVYTNVSDRLTKTAQAITTQNETAERTQKVNSRMNTMQSALQNKLDLSNPATVSEISAQDPELGTALSNYSLNKSDVKDEDAAFADATQKIFSAGSKEEISKYTMNVLKEGKISQDRLNVLLGSAMDRGKTLADLANQSKSGNPVQNLIDQGMKVLFGTNANEAHPNAQTLVDYMKAVKDGKTVPEAIQHAQGQDAVRENPHLLNIPPNGQIFHDKNGNRRIVYPDLHTEAIGGGKMPKEDKNGTSDNK